MKNTTDTNDERNGRPSASSGEANEACPPRERMSRGMPNTTNKVAQAGDRIHERLAGNKNIKLSSDEEYMASLCERDRAALYSLVFSGSEDGATLVESIEERRWYARNRFSGKADVVAWKGRKALILDYKTGRVPVSHAKDNGQLRWLAVLWNQRKRFDEITVAISQPHCGAMTTYTYDAAALKKARLRVMSALRKMESPDARFRVGEKQCKYCRAKSICPALKDSEMTIKAIDKVESLTPAQMSGLLDVIPIIEERCKSIKAAATTMLTNGANIDGYTLIDGQSRRKVTDPMGAYVFLTGAGLIDDHHFLDAATISVAKLQKAIAEYNDLSVGEAKKEMEDKLELFIKTDQSAQRISKELA